MSPDDPRHGSIAGASAHYKAHETLCEPCRLASNDYARHRSYESDAGRPRMLSSLTFRRRVEALRAIGWSKDTIADRLDVRLSTVARHRPYVTRDLHERMVELYTAMSATAPSDRFASRRAKIARDRGCVPPAAWDDIDDPAEVSFVGAEARRSQTELLEEFDWLVGGGESQHQAARRLGVGLNAIEMARSRAGKAS